MRDTTSASSFFFFNDTATTEIYTLSLHDALPISSAISRAVKRSRRTPVPCSPPPRPSSCRSSSISSSDRRKGGSTRSEEHTSELQSRLHLVCRLLLEKKKDSHMTHIDNCTPAGVH